MGQMSLADGEIANFLVSRTSEDARASAWKANSLAQLRNTYKKILCEAG
jgi:hypothetical protein